MEEWKDIAGYEGFYQVSTYGRVKALSRVVVCKNGMPKPLRERILIPRFNTNGYLWVHLNRNGKKEFWFVHRLVALAFVPNPQGKLFVNHKTGKKTDNVASLLEWTTRKENVAHAFSIGLMSHAGEKNSQSKLTNTLAQNIREDRSNGMTVKAIAAKYVVSTRCIYDVINGKSWEQCA